VESNDLRQIRIAPIRAKSVNRHGVCLLPVGIVERPGVRLK
jgi:hypothetical protein